MAFATPEQAGEVCACQHSAGRHVAVPGPIPAGRLACPRPCDCGCPDFRHWAEGKPMWSVRLACGCGFLAHYVPKPGVGAYVSCTASLRHQTSYRIESVTQVSVEAKQPEAATVTAERRPASPEPAGPAVQLDLFGEVEAAEQDARDREQARADWLARFEQADWITPWDTAAGPRPGDPPLKKGERSPVPGWRCPDPECGKVEVNSTLLANDHGWDPHTPGYEPFDGRCHRVRLLRAHAAADAKEAARA